MAPQVTVDYPLEHQELLAQHTALHARRLYLIVTCYFYCSVSSYVADIMSRSRLTNHRCVGCSQAMVEVGGRAQNFVYVQDTVLKFP